MSATHNVQHATNEFSIDKFDIELESGTKSFKRNLIRLDLYETMFMFFTTGSAHVLTSKVDAAELVNAKSVSVSFNSKDSLEPVTGTFLIAQTTRNETEGKETAVTTIHFAAPEAFANNTRRENRPFPAPGSNAACKASDIVKSILVDTLLFKETDTQKLDWEDSLNDETYTFTGVEPLFGIAQMLRRAVVPSQPEAVNFFFWGDRSGYHFKSFESMVAGEVVQNLYYTVNNQDRADTYTLNVKAIHVPSSANVFSATKAGLYKADGDFYDLLKKKIVKPKLELPKWINTLKKLDKTQTWRPEDDPDSTGSRRVGVFDPTGTNKKIEEFALKRTAQMANITSFIVHVITYGETDIRIGNVVNLIYPNSATSGKYVVTAIRHCIDQLNYEMHMELVKDSLSAPTVTSDE